VRGLPAIDPANETSDLHASNQNPTASRHPMQAKHGSPSERERERERREGPDTATLALCWIAGVELQQWPDNGGVREGPTVGVAAPPEPLPP
jgi:hypothetical protein